MDDDDKLISLTKSQPPVNQPIYIMSSVFKLTIVLVPLMLSHLLVHSPPLLSLIVIFSTPRLISGTNFMLHLVNKFQLLMMISAHLSLLHFLHPSLLHSFTLNLKRTFSTNPFNH